MIFSGALPPRIQDIKVLHKFFPIAAIEGSHFIGSIIGALLLILAYGMKKRLSLAYYLSIFFLIFGIIISLIRDLGIVSASILFFILLIILPSKKYFYRKSSIFAEKLSVKWILMAGITLTIGLYIGVLTHNNDLYSTNIFWKFPIFISRPKL